jgi:hypothetical protein
MVSSLGDDALWCISVACRCLAAATTSTRTVPMPMTSEMTSSSAVDPPWPALSRSRRSWPLVILILTFVPVLPTMDVFGASPERSAGRPQWSSSSSHAVTLGRSRQLQLPICSLLELGSSITVANLFPPIGQEERTLTKKEIS